MEKKSCYTCKYRGMVPGSAHSCCRHPEVVAAEDSANTFAMLVQLLSGGFKEAARKLGIEGDPMGIRRGWFSWPADFDPTWLRACNGFEAKDE